MRILVVGLPKSGTTILTYRIASALRDATVEFEPIGGPDPELAEASATIVTKKLVGSQTATLADFAHYDRRIWISRDPRDFLVSQSLYRWHRDTPPTEADRRTFELAMADLEAKEADPAAVPFLALDPADYSATFDRVADLWRREGDESWLLYRYEEMVTGRYEALERYLGFEIDRGATVASGLERVVRRKAAGDWRDWFTIDDVAHFAAGGLADYMKTFGYDHRDWVLNPEPRIEPEHGSRYVRALFDDHLGADARVIATPGPAVESAGPRPGVASDGAARRLLGRVRSHLR